MFFLLACSKFFTLVTTCLSLVSCFIKSVRKSTVIWQPIRWRLDKIINMKWLLVSYQMVKSVCDLVLWPIKTLLTPVYVGTYMFTLLMPHLKRCTFMRADVNLNVCGMYNTVCFVLLCFLFFFVDISSFKKCECNFSFEINANFGEILFKNETIVRNCLKILSFVHPH